MNDGNELRDVFFERIDKQPDGCWIWKGPTDARGFPLLNYKKKQWRVNRLSFELFVRKIKKGMSITHSCKHKDCVNPDHLIEMSKKDTALHITARDLTVKGESAPQTILSEDDVRDMRTKYHDEQWTMSMLREHFNVAHATVQAVVSGKTWKHVA